jgi:hypothetical protein
MPVASDVFVIGCGAESSVRTFRYEPTTGWRDYGNVRCRARERPELLR